VAAVALLALLVTRPGHGAAPPRPGPLTGAQQARLRERDRLTAEARRLLRAGKPAEALAPWERILTLEGAVLGPAHPEVADSLEVVAWLRESAGQARRELLALRLRLHGPGHWRVTDARWALADGQRRARLTEQQRRLLAQAELLSRQAIELGTTTRNRGAGREVQKEGPSRYPGSIRRYTSQETRWTPLPNSAPTSTA
jgi:hypothetical protein